ncbi:MAG: hypothetical protein IKV57_06985 [Clostridia bacterium]|nr:hypothetical protein [Clostridia bacterium]
MIVGKKGAQEVCGRLVEMGMRYIGDDMVGYNTDREKLKLYLEELAKSEKVSWEGVL